MRGSFRGLARAGAAALVLLVGAACSRDPAADAVARACAAAPCSDVFARVTLWRDASGEVALLVHEGSLERCSHPPTTTFTPDGQTRLAQPNRPVEGPEDAARLQAERDAVFAGLVRDPCTRSCP